jgi:Zn-dependent protease
MIEIAVFVFLGWILSLCLHEFGHAIAAYYGGDTSVKEKGYLTLNPLKYVDPVLTLIMPIDPRELDSLQNNAHDTREAPHFSAER